MANDPTYVRLPDRLTTGCIADLESGWFIGGNDVKKFPDAEASPQAAAFVRDKVRQGHLEPASKAEHEEVQATRDELSSMHLSQLDTHEAHDRYGHQEQHLQDAGAAARARLAKLRLTDGEEADEDVEDEGDAVAGSMMAVGGSQGPVDHNVTASGAKKSRTATKRAAKSTTTQEGEDEG